MSYTITHMLCAVDFQSSHGINRKRNRMNRGGRANRHQQFHMKFVSKFNIGVIEFKSRVNDTRSTASLFLIAIMLPSFGMSLSFRSRSLYTFTDAFIFYLLIFNGKQKKQNRKRFLSKSKYINRTNDRIHAMIYRIVYICNGM